MRSKTLFSTEDLYSRCFASAVCLYCLRTYWADASFRARDLILALVPAAFPQVAIQRSNISRAWPSTPLGTSTFMLSKSLVTSLRYNDRQWSLYTRHSDQIAHVLWVSVFDGHKEKWSSCCYILLCFRRHQNVEIGTEWSPFGVPTLCTFFHRAVRKHRCRRLRVWTGSSLISGFFIVFIWISGFVLFGLRWSTRLLFNNSFPFLLFLWTLSLWAFLFLWWLSTVAHAILWIHGCWIFICVLRRWMWRYALTRSGSFVSSGATSLFSCWWWSSWWWWGIHIWTVLIWYIIRFWSNHGLNLWDLWDLWMRCTRSRDFDCHRCSSSCGGWSSSPSITGIGISWGSGGEDRRGNRSRDVFPGPALFLYHQQVMELEAIMLVGQADLAVQESRRFGRSTRPNHERR